MMEEKTERFDEVKIGDIIEVEFSTGNQKDKKEKRRGIVQDIKYDEDLMSNVILYDECCLIAEYRMSKTSGINNITKIITKETNPEYFL